MDRGAWRATVHGVTKSQSQSDLIESLSMHSCKPMSPQQNTNEKTSTWCEHPSTLRSLRVHSQGELGLHLVPWDPSTPAPSQLCVLPLLQLPLYYSWDTDQPWVAQPDMPTAQGVEWPGASRSQLVRADFCVLNFQGFYKPGGSLKK